MYLEKLMNQGEAMDWGICGIGLLPADLGMYRALVSQDTLYTVVTKEATGKLQAQVVGSLVKYLYAPDGPDAVLDMLTDPTVRIVSLTITEGGYNIDRASGRFDIGNQAVLDDVTAEHPSTVFGYVVEALRRRRHAGVPPFSVMSCDNIESNGAVARYSMVSFAKMKDPRLAAWIDTEVCFPNSMVDRITPVTTPTDIGHLADEFHVEDAWPVVCEPFSQWVLEDRFNSGRPPLEDAGVQVTEDVTPYELMKLRLLNAGHQALAYNGHLCGYTYAHEAASDPVFVEFLLGYMNNEARPTLGPVPGIDLDLYVATLIERFGNPEVKDTIARLCAFSSDRIPKWLVPVIRANLVDGGPIQRSAEIVASWARYAEGIDERGQPIDVQDALRDELMQRAGAQRDDLLAFLRNEHLFGQLANDQRFAEAYGAALQSLHEMGTHRTLVELNARCRS
jgi:mannitol 2-dehydrogenase